MSKKLIRSLLAVFVAMSILVAFAPVARAVVWIDVVRGTVTNPDSSPAVGASVIVDCNTVYHFGHTDITGYYEIPFNSGECPSGSMVTAQVVNDALHGNNQAVLTGDPAERLDVVLTSGQVVPEFGMLTGAVASLVSGGLFLLKKRAW